jgi:hypothetical protein
LQQRFSPSFTIQNFFLSFILATFDRWCFGWVQLCNSRRVALRIWVVKTEFSVNPFANGAHKVIVAIQGTVAALSHILAFITPAEQIQNTPSLILGTLIFCISLACFAIWRAASDFRGLTVLGLYFLVVALDQFWLYLRGYESDWIMRIVAPILFVEVAARVMRVPNHRWTMMLWPAYFFIFLAGWIFSAQFVRENFPVFVSEGTFIILLVQFFWNGNPRDRRFAFIFAIYGLMRLSLSPALVSLLHIARYLVLSGWRWPIIALTVALFGFITLWVIVRDLLQDRREKQRLATEIEAARLVQQVLIPEEIPSVSGFAIRAVYQPFSEVGGDFFQILPVAQDGVLIVIGDVSGKGMPAAMTVSLFIGTIRTLARYTQSPAEILAEMKQRMLGRSRGGFTTCLALRVDSRGVLTVANAGHISPYLRGTELDIQGGLPLGLAAEATYAESTFSLSFGHQLTLLTDGVVEARNLTGELLGFERTAEIAGEAAELIAQKAKEFGQNDDITVLTIARVAAEAESPIGSTGPVLSPSLA